MSLVLSRLDVYDTFGQVFERICARFGVFFESLFFTAGSLVLYEVKAGNFAT